MWTKWLLILGVYIPIYPPPHRYAPGYKLTPIIQSRRLTLFGHIMRMDDNADAKRILLASPLADWRRQLGRPRITWLSTIQQDLKQHHLTLPETEDLAQNRPLWRMMSTYGAMPLWVACQKRRRRVVYLKPKQLIKDCARRFILKLYRHEALRGLFATADLLVTLNWQKWANNFLSRQCTEMEAVVTEIMLFKWLCRVLLFSAYGMLWPQLHCVS